MGLDLVSFLAGVILCGGLIGFVKLYRAHNTIHIVGRLSNVDSV